jgi:hypothetical protein
MAPTILDGDHVLFVRGSWGLAPGDIVIYDPSPPPPPDTVDPGTQQGLPAPGEDARGLPNPSSEAATPLRNTAVVDPQELERNWQRTQQRSGATQRRQSAGYRVGRILALPGDTVTFNVEDAVLGLAVNGQSLAHKPGDSMRIVLREEHEDAQDRATRPRRRATAFEAVGDRRYTVLRSSTSPDVLWPGLQIPAASEGPVEVRAEGYLVVADNRDEGACCDSRAIGWVPAQGIRGEIVWRLPGDPSLTPDLAPAARGSRWLP